MRRSSLALLALTSLLVLRGATCKVERPYAAPTAQELTAAVRARGLRVSSLRGETRMSHRSSQGKVKATVRLMARRGGSLRFDVVSPFDTPLATLVVSGGRFALIDAEKNRHFHGPAAPCNIARLLQVMLEPDDILTILGGSTPLISHQRASVAWDARAGAEVLTLSGPAAVQTVRLDGYGRRWDLLSSEVRTSAGELVLRVEASDQREVKGLRLPRAIHVSQPKLGAELDLTFKQEEVNLELPEGAFELPAAGGLPSQEVQCSTEIKP